MSKIQFWKQFTTTKRRRVKHPTLYSICQRYNFESNLQLFGCILQLGGSCIRYVKDTILKAIYNANNARYFLQNAVFDMSKIQFWKQFTTASVKGTYANLLYSICQRYNFESNLQRHNDRRKQVKSCIRYVKDTILKAIYNFD